jgi:hypothetical protein
MIYIQYTSKNKIKNNKNFLFWNNILINYVIKIISEIQNHYIYTIKKPII